jgi:hypothetical protein
VKNGKPWSVEGWIENSTKSEQRLARDHIESVFLADFDAGAALDSLVAGRA